MTNLFRSLVFVPGNNPRFLEKAKSLSGDIVCFDLEDSVPDNEKQNARTLISKKLKERKDFMASVFVRTNSPQSGKIPNDLAKVIQKGLAKKKGLQSNWHNCTYLKVKEKISSVAKATTENAKFLFEINGG